LDLVRYQAELISEQVDHNQCGPAGECIKNLPALRGCSPYCLVAERYRTLSVELVGILSAATDCTILSLDLVCDRHRSWPQPQVRAAFRIGEELMADERRSADFAGPKNRWPILPSLASYRAAFLTRDLVAGLTLVAVAIPEQMATARLGGFAPQTGFFAFVAGSLAFALFGDNRILSCGADSTITPIFAGSLALVAASGSADYTALGAALALMVGLVLVAGGIFRLGWIADLLSIPVTTGFLIGISVHILFSQLPTILELPSPGGTMLERVAALAGHLNAANPFSLLIAFGVLGVIALSERIDARLPGALMGLGAATAAVVLMGLESRGVTVLGSVAGGLPTLAIPEISAGQLADLVPLSLIIATVVMVQTAATTRSFPSDPDEPPNVDRDFIGVGAGSILSGVVGAFPVNASPPRTAIVSETRGQSQIAGLVAAGVVLALAAFGAKLLQPVPQAALAGVLLFIALRIIRVHQVVAIYQQSLGEFLLIASTAAAIIVLPIAQGVAIGIALSLFHGIWSTTRARVSVFERVPGTSVWWPPTPHVRGATEPDILVAGFAAPLSFLNAYRFRQDVLDAARSSTPRPRLIVLEATGILDIDFTAAQILGDVIRRCHADGIDFSIARLESVRAQDALARFGIEEVLGPDHVFRSVEEAIRAFGGPTRAKDARPPAPK
jgi:sulfate permease, SulP family